MKPQLTKNEIETKLRVFFQEHVPTFIKLRYGNSFKLLNGFIIKIDGSYVTLDDIKLGHFPLSKSDILNVDVSTYRELRGIKRGEQIKRGAY